MSLPRHTYFEQLNPHLDSVYYSLRRYFIDEFYLRQAEALPAGSRVLDLGGHKIRKRGQFNIEHYNLPVTYVNLTPVKRPDVQADAARVPLRSSSFEVVICSELLEHVPHPPAVLGEVHRLLQPGGIALLGVPFLHPIHGDPYDFGRYTDHYWQTVLGDIGFEQIHIERQGQFFVVLADFIKLYAAYARWHKRRRYRPLLWLLRRGQRWALRMEQRPARQEHPFFRAFTTGFGIRACKKG